jgi:ABC-type transporter Mla MlaB component
MGTTTEALLQGYVKVLLLAPQVLEFRLRGYISRGVLARSLAEATAVVEAHPEVTVTLWDATGVTGYDAGNVAVGIEWSRTRGRAVRASALVTRSPTVAAFTRVASVLLPWVQSLAFTTREEALAFVEGAVRARRHTPPRGVLRRAG